jgi:hypothetical protein
VHGFNMDEWSDAQGNTLPPDNHGAFQYAMEQAFYGPLGKLTVPPKQRHFAVKTELPSYAAQIAELKKQGAKLVTVFGIGRVCHIAFWEPHFAAEFDNAAAWKAHTHRLGAKLHPLTVEQNALTSFRSRTTLVPAFANTIGPGLFLAADRIIGGAEHAVAGSVAAHDAAARAHTVDSEHLHADAAGAAVLPEGAARAAGGGVSLRVVRGHRTCGSEAKRQWTRVTSSRYWRTGSTRRPAHLAA